MKLLQSRKSIYAHFSKAYARELIIKSLKSV